MPAVNDWLTDLNPEQYAAVTAPFGHQLVLAGAGCGKTKVLVSRIAYLIHSGDLSLDSVLAVTFTNKAAGEMKQRLATLLNRPVAQVWMGTFHGLGHRLLRRHFEQARLSQNFQILDSDDQLRVIKRVIAELQLDPEQWPPKQAQSFISSNKEEGLRPQHVHLPSYGPGKTWLAIYKSYEQACQRGGIIDFAEILLRCYELFRDNPDILAHYQARFRMILVDEFQDTNTIQYAWLRLLAGESIKLMVVGDDDQSIYGWRGAKIEHIQRFERDFPGTQLVRLEQNYRSTGLILQAANALIMNNQSRMGKSLWTAGREGNKITLFAAFNEIEEARFVVERTQREHESGHALSDIAILYRSNAQSRVLEEALLRAGIPYRIHGGMRFFERAEIKDTLGYLRLVVNPGDDAAFERVVNLPVRGIGDKTLDLIRDKARENSVSLWQASKEFVSTLPARAAKALSGFLTLIEQLEQAIKGLPLEEQVALVMNDSGLYSHYALIKGDVAESKLQNLQELVSAAKEFFVDENQDESNPLLGFLAQTSLDAGDMQAEVHEDYVQLMTLHSAKGLEFSLVFLVGMEEGIFPAKQSRDEPARLEEERRLCYVGMTRAMQQLILSYAEIRRLYGREEYHRPSRFLNEIPKELLDEIRTRSRPAMPSFESRTSSQDSGLCLGQMVLHNHFGRGLVLALEGAGAHSRVQVKFEDHGVKWLVLAYANLQPSS